VGLVAGGLSSCYSRNATTCGDDTAELALVRGELMGNVLLEDDAGVVRLRLDPLEAGVDAAPASGDAPLAPGAIVLQGANAFVVVRDGRGDIVPLDEAGRPVYPWAQFEPGKEPVLKRAPSAGSTVLIEQCGLYTHNPDPSKRHPNYRYATLSGPDGRFEVMVPKGKIGLHTFRSGTTYGRTEIEDAPERVALVANDGPFFEGAARKQPPPVLKSFRVDRAEIGPGGSLTFTVEVTHAGSDPMSEELIVFEPTTKVARAFGPPVRGRNDNFKKAFPDGTWTATTNAPTAPGTYTFYAHGTSENCVNAERLALEVVVR